MLRNLRKHDQKTKEVISQLDESLLSLLKWRFISESQHFNKTKAHTEDQSNLPEIWRVHCPLQRSVTFTLSSTLEINIFP